MESYLDDKMHFLQDLRDIHPTNNFANGFPEALKEFIEKKLNLISCIGNILHDLDGKYLKMYQIYTEHV